MGKCFPETSRWSQAEADVTAMNRDNWVNREELRAYVELAEAFFKRNKRDSNQAEGNAMVATARIVAAENAALTVY